jgi:integrase
MIKRGRISNNPLATVEKVAFVPAFVRRAYQDDEIKRLLEVAGESRVGYLLALHTGLRRAELKALRWEHMHLDADVPRLVLTGEFTKNNKGRVHPAAP